LSTFHPDAEGFGDVIIDHAVPFQCSIRVASDEPLVTEFPTAQQSDVNVQVTALRIALWAVGGVGDAVIDHALPFQCSMSGEP
jgi:hypothetical protein